jgi:antitoxin HicB
MAAPHVYKLRLVLTPDPSGGFTVTSPDLPELVTEGDTPAQALANVSDAIVAVRELYADLGKPLPACLQPVPGDRPLEFETLIGAA